MLYNLTEGFVHQLMEQNTALIRQNESFSSRVEELTATVRELNQAISELEEKLNKNFKNSFRQPSSDDLKQLLVNKDRSLRKRSGKKQEV